MNEKGKNFHKIVVFAAFLGFFGVGAGAFGAHALKDRLTEAGMVEVWRTAVEYQLFHAVAMLALTAWVETAGKGGKRTDTWARKAAWLWLAGVMLFSGSLYALALGGPRWLGPVTPLGGVCLLAGWVAMGLAGAARRGPE